MKAMPPNSESVSRKGAPREPITMPQSSVPKPRPMRVIKRGKPAKSRTQSSIASSPAEALSTSAKQDIKVSPAMVLARLEDLMKTLQSTDVELRAAVAHLSQRLVVMEASITKSLSLQEMASRNATKTMGTPLGSGPSERDPETKVDANAGAKLLCISRAKFYAMVKDGRLPQGILIGQRSRRWTRVELLAAASAAKAVAPPPSPQVEEVELNH